MRTHCNQINPPSDDHLHVEINYLVGQPVETREAVNVLHSDPNLVGVNEGLKDEIIINCEHLSNLV